VSLIRFPITSNLKHNSSILWVCSRQAHSKTLDLKKGSLCQDSDSSVYLGASLATTQTKKQTNKQTHDRRIGTWAKLWSLGHAIFALEISYVVLQFTHIGDGVVREDGAVGVLVSILWIIIPTESFSAKFVLELWTIFYTKPIGLFSDKYELLCNSQTNMNFFIKPHKLPHKKIIGPIKLF
jgi:hypothetical protein